MLICVVCMSLWVLSPPQFTLHTSCPCLNAKHFLACNPPCSTGWGFFTRWSTFSIGMGAVVICYKLHLSYNVRGTQVNTLTLGWCWQSCYENCFFASIGQALWQLWQRCYEKCCFAKLGPMLAQCCIGRANRVTQNRFLAEVSLLPEYTHKLNETLLYFSSYMCTGTCSRLKDNS